MFYIKTGPNQLATLVAEDGKIKIKPKLDPELIFKFIFLFGLAHVTHGLSTFTDSLLDPKVYIPISLSILYFVLKRCNLVQLTTFLMIVTSGILIYITVIEKIKDGAMLGLLVVSLVLYLTTNLTSSVSQMIIQKEELIAIQKLGAVLPMIVTPLFLGVFLAEELTVVLVILLIIVFIIFALLAVIVDTTRLLMITPEPINHASRIVGQYFNIIIAYYALLCISI